MRQQAASTSTHVRILHCVRAGNCLMADRFGVSDGSVFPPGRLAPRVPDNTNMLGAITNRLARCCAVCGRQVYTRQKAIMQRWPERISKGNEFIMPTAK
jgi:hypothetical protein